MALILLDIDGTLVKGLGPYESSLKQAIQETHDSDLQVDLTPYHGHTDRFIARDILKRNNLSYDNKSLDECLLMFGKNYQANEEHTKIIPGVAEALPQLAEKNLLGIVTGNVETMAMKKLRLYGLNQHIKLGAFGNEDVDRSELVGYAIHRAKKEGWNGDKNNTYLVDDTLVGINAAINAQVIPVGVLTGKVRTKTEFQNARAKYIIFSLLELLGIVN